MSSFSLHCWLIGTYYLRGDVDTMLGDAHAVVLVVPIENATNEIYDHGGTL
jgi:hypothetical protein